MKSEEGVVIEVIGDVAKVKAGRHNECKNCGACPGDNSVIICAKNGKGAKPGQRVIFEAKEENSLMAAFVVFILPLINVFVGVVIGNAVSHSLGLSVPVCETIGGTVTFLISLILIKLFNNNLSGNEKFQPKIIKVL